eukprot:TRINITY_DN123995_c0_g1_i1.p1 TRINITY_DN123995_c0_g1~~TRINITY_DN123995_c0_g1_i1.p1  ORF type:complete len:305 (+),score=-31.23 TRINITY_DN123995_c0_g1_i1:96-917(+)
MNIQSYQNKIHEFDRRQRYIKRIELIRQKRKAMGGSPSNAAQPTPLSLDRIRAVEHRCVEDMSRRYRAGQALNHQEEDIILDLVQYYNSPKDFSEAVRSRVFSRFNADFPTVDQIDLETIITRHLTQERQDLRAQMTVGTYPLQTHIKRPEQKEGPGQPPEEPREESELRAVCDSIGFYSASAATVSSGSIATYSRLKNNSADPAALWILGVAISLAAAFGNYYMARRQRRQKLLMIPLLIGLLLRLCIYYQGVFGLLMLVCIYIIQVCMYGF